MGAWDIFLGIEGLMGSFFGKADEKEKWVVLMGLIEKHVACDSVCAYSDMDG